MPASRHFRKIIAGLLAAVLLFAQFAVASYACPRMIGHSVLNAGGDTVGAVPAAVPAVDVAMDAMPDGCDAAEPGNANLCAEHCRFGQQTADSAATPQVWQAVPLLLYPLAVAPALRLDSAPPGPARHRRWVAALAPPHAILHCVSRT